MIASLQTPWEPDTWSRELKTALRDPAALLARLSLTPEGVDFDPDFPLRAPLAYVDRMRPGDADDPLLRQVLPRTIERCADDVSFVSDPLEEAAATRAPGLIQKYRGRALLITTPACAVHCRYCFRRHFPYAKHRRDQNAAALDTIAADRSLEEVILSGGDPWVLPDSELAELLGRLESMPHILRVRFHTRLPVVVPTRVTSALLTMLAETRLKTVVVVHANHANELDAATATAFDLLRRANVTLLNQSVLLRGVNDSARPLAELSLRLFDQGVLPYYLHLPDRVAGTRHFFVSEPDARAVHGALAARLPGYLVPVLAQEIPGGASKRFLA